MNSKTLQNIAAADTSSKAMASPHKMQQYLERHRLKSLFETLMNRLVHDQPEDPHVYLIRTLYKKAGLDIPDDLPETGVRRSSVDRSVQRSRSPQFSRKPTQAWASSSIDDKDRSYNKPWLSNSKKGHTRQSEDSTLTKQANSRVTSPRQSLRQRDRQKSQLSNENSIEDILIIQPITPVKRQVKQPWNPDAKVKSTSFDDLFDDKEDENRRPEIKENGDSKTDKAIKKTVDVMGVEKPWEGTVDDKEYSDGSYSGPKVDRDRDDPLAGELRNSRREPEDEDERRDEKRDVNVTSNTRIRYNRNIDSGEHKSFLAGLLSRKKKHDDPENGHLVEPDQPDEVDEPDEAIEMLEDADDLKKEGVTEVPATGYKLSRVLKQREEDAKLKVNINVYTGERPGDSVVDDGNDAQGQEAAYESEEERPQTGMSGFKSSPGDSDLEDFESVSQVTGPRRPVWNSVQDSDGERPYSPKLSKTLPEPSKSRKMQTEAERKLMTTAPAKSKQSYQTRSVESAESFLDQSPDKSMGTEAKSVDVDDPSVSRQESVPSEAGGWQIPQYESDTSVADWSQYGGKTKGRRPAPRAY